MREPATPRAMFPGILLCSTAVLMLEVLLTRVFSFSIWYHLAYLTISTALLGFGAAGSLLAAYPRFLEGDVRLLAARCSAGAGLGVIVIAALLAPWPLEPTALFSAPVRFFFGLLGYYALVSTPFFLGGVAVAATLSRHAAQVDRLYAADLLGAALGCILALFSLTYLDGPGALALTAALFVTAGAVYAPPGGTAAGFGALALVLLVSAPVAGRVVDFQPAPSKALGQALATEGVRMLYTRWSPVNRVDLYQMPMSEFTFWAGFGRSPAFKGDPPKALSLQYDGHNGSSVFGVRGPDSLAMFDSHLLRTPYLLQDKPRVLVIGVGGGIDVLNALRRGASAVTGVELQPITVALLQNELTAWTGGQLRRGEVRLVAAEGRHWMGANREVYDLVQMTMTDTFSAQSTGSFVLVESYLYTLEAFDELLDHVHDDGLVSIVVGDYVYRDAALPPPYTTRLALTAAEALRRRGSENPAAHIMHISQENRSADSPGEVSGSLLSNLLIKPVPFTPDEIAQVRDFTASNGFDLATPGASPKAALAAFLRAPGPELDAALDGQPFELRPATDDRPFFYHVLPWRSLFGGASVIWVNPGSTTGQLMLLMMLAQGLLLGTFLILLPLRRGASAGLSRVQTAGFLVYFLGLGLGFLLIEISFVQKYVLLLGYPTYSLSVTIFALLLFSALGAFLSRRGWQRPERSLRRLLAATLALVAAEILILPWVRDQFMASPLAARIGLTLTLQLPLGLCLGMYFPTGIELLRRSAPGLIPWAWGVNGVASVVSTVLAVVLGMSIGFSGVALVAAAIYAVGTLGLLRILPQLAGQRPPVG